MQDDWALEFLGEGFRAAWFIYVYFIYIKNSDRARYIDKVYMDGPNQYEEIDK